jgi:hypothetical protein
MEKQRFKKQRPRIQYSTGKIKKVSETLSTCSVFLVALNRPGKKSLQVIEANMFNSGQSPERSVAT